MDTYKCNLSIVTCKAEGREQAEIVTQLLYGETVLLLEKEDKWVKIVSTLDNYECYIDRKIFEGFEKNTAASSPCYINESLVEIESDGKLFRLLMGADASRFKDLISPELFGIKNLQDLPELLDQFMGTPYLWGGRSVFGIDCSGLTQILYRVMGKNIPRDASQQILDGDLTIEFINSKIGDLAFFNNNKGKITHVGVISRKTKETAYIVHASGWVREDLLDVKGILDESKGEYTHYLHSIKRYNF